MSIVIYTKDGCPFCTKAKNLLSSKDLTFEEVNIGGNDELRNEMISKSAGAKSVPQIFIGEKHIGGSDALEAMNNSGELEAILKQYHFF